MAKPLASWHQSFNLEALLNQATLLRNNIKCDCDPHQNAMVGSSNYAVILTFDDGVEWVFRYPLFGGEHMDLKVVGELLESEVATMKCVAKRTSVPVPEIFAYSSTNENPLGVPYILMSKAKGVQLNTLGWDIDLQYPTQPYLNEIQKRKIMKQLGLIVSQLNDIRFDELGSIIERDGMYFVGECLAPAFIFHDREKLLDIPRGPFYSDKAYYDALLFVYLRHLEKLPLYGNVFFDPKPCEKDFKEWDAFFVAFDEWSLRTPAQEESLQNLLDYHTAGRFMGPMISSLESTSSPSGFSLHHHDLSTSNIFVNDKLEISCIIDWAYASTVPTSTANSTPGLPHPRDGTEPHLERAFRSAFNALKESTWISARRASHFTRLCLLDSQRELFHFKELLDIGELDLVEVARWFQSAQRTEDDLIQLATELAQDDAYKADEDRSK